MKNISLIGVAMVFAGILFTGGWVIREGRAVDRRRARRLLADAYFNWNKRGRPMDSNLVIMLSDYRGWVPVIDTNEIRMGNVSSRTVFAFPGSVPGEHGRLCVTTNGLIVVIDANRIATLAR